MSDFSGMAATQPQGSSRLPKKEVELFRSVVNCYETKQYRKGIKNADLILKKFPNHGETLAMKGLIMNCMNKKEEAYDLVKQGLKLDVRSHICWHVFGLLHRSDNNYKEAIKCYLNALRIDSENQNILRDLSWLQIQMRDYQGFINSRKKMLDSRPTLRASWVTFAAATFLGGEYDLAATVVTKYNESIDSKDKADKYEESELLLFQNRCLEMQQKYDEAITHLDTHEHSIVDKLELRTKKAEFFTRTGRFEEAQEMWMALLLTQTENYHFHRGVQAAYLRLSPELCAQTFALKRLELPSTTFSLTCEEKAMLLNVYQTNDRLQKSRAVKKIELTLAEGEQFRELLDAHCRRCLRDAVPALFHDVCSLIRAPNPAAPSQRVLVEDPADFRVNETYRIALELVEGYVRNLKQFDSFDSKPRGENEAAEEPTCLLWSYYLLAHLLEIAGRLDDALAVIDECIVHTPTALDVLVKRAQILKRIGRIDEAATVMDEVRALDLQDRYLNNKATKYLLRANRIPEAMETIAMFTKHDGDPQQMLHDLQCNWYELELAEAYERTRQWGLALKKFYAIQKHFDDYVEDMFDFHHYSMRKTTLRMYIDTLKMQDNIYAHKFYQRAARGALRIFLHLIDNPEDIDGLAHLPTAERKKERAKLKKRKAKEAAQLEAKLKAEEEESNTQSGKNSKPKDTDPNGDKILTKNFIEEADKWCQFLLPRASLCHGDTLALVSEVLFRRQKFTQTMRALHCGLRSHPSHPGLTVVLVKTARRVLAQDGAPALNLKEAVLAALRNELRGLLFADLHEPNATSGAAQLPEIAHDSVNQFVGRYVDRAKQLYSLPHRVAAAKCLVATATKAGAGAARQLGASLLLEDGIWEGRGVSIKTATEAHKTLEEWKLDIEAEAFRSAATSKFPAARDFVPMATIQEGNEGEQEAGEP